MFLGELNIPVTKLKGVGVSTAQSFANMNIHTVGDLILHVPRAYEDRKNFHPLSGALKYGVISTIVTVAAHEYFGFGSKRTLKVIVEDDSGRATLACFGRNFLEKQLQVGKVIFLYGSFSYKYGELQCSSFDFEDFSEEPQNFDKILPIYSLSEKLTQGAVRKIITKALGEYITYIDTELPTGLIQQYGLMGKAEALKQIHFPDSKEQLEKAHKTLVYEELFHLQILMGKKAKDSRESRPKSVTPVELQKKLIQSLPFELTPDQVTVLEEIRRDTESDTNMTRLIQGDVGSGKTLVAFLAALPYIERGQQAAFMAPTELLAKQHAENAAKLLEPLGISLAFLSASIKKKQRDNLLAALKAGHINLVIGTHALFSSGVEFKDLALAIIDEQHRFGVLQRESLKKKGKNPDMLLMTATPIPRTLALTAFGDLDVSDIKTMPKGRKPIITHLARQENIEKVYAFVEGETKKGRQAYFVYPLISQTEKRALKDVETMHQELNDRFGNAEVGIIHSKIGENEKKETMERFANKEIHILAATSVVEVGVDIPNSTCMVIEHSELFGLSALHQLRGRVGRGEHQSYCFLVYTDKLTDDGKTRLKVMKETTDGFIIAEEDLKIRGPGDIAGVKQSGFLRLHIASLTTDTDILLDARNDALSIMESDPGLLLPEHASLRELYAKAPPFADDLCRTG